MPKELTAGERAKILRDFIASDPKLTIYKFSEKRGLGHSTVHRWATDETGLGRSELNEAERAELDKRVVDSSAGRAPRKSPQEAKEFLEGYLATSEGTTLRAYAKVRSVPSRTAYNWASGNRSAAVKALLTPEQQAELARRLEERGGHRTGGKRVAKATRSAAPEPDTGLSSAQPPQWGQSYAASSPWYDGAAFPFAPQDQPGVLGSGTMATAAAAPPALTAATSFGYDTYGPLPPLPNTVPRPDPFHPRGGGRGR